MDPTKQGWLKVNDQTKSGSLLSFKKHQKMWVVLDNRLLLGYSSDKLKNTVHFKIKVDDATLLSNLNKDENQFEVSTDEYHLHMVAASSEEALSWLTSIQTCRTDYISMSSASSINDNLMVRSIESESKEKTSIVVKLTKNGVNNGNNTKREKVFDDPLRSADLSNFRLQRSPVRKSGNSLQFNDDTSSTADPWIKNEDLDESSDVYQLTKELSNEQKKYKKLRDEYGALQETLAAKNKQLFDMHDQVNDQNNDAIVRSDLYREQVTRVKSLETSNLFLNNELRKQNKDLRESRKLAALYKRDMEFHLFDLKMYQRDYVKLVGELVYKPLADPIHGAIVRSSDNQRIIKDLSLLNENVKKLKHHNVPLVSWGSKEFVDKYRFVHSVPNVATRMHYCSRQLTKALNEIYDCGPDSTQNCKIWENVIFDNSPDKFRITERLKKLVLEDIPDRYRGFVWQQLIHEHVKSSTHEPYDIIGSDGQHLSYFYEKLALKDDLMEGNKQFAKYMKQIIMDVPRTMPRNRRFAVEDPKLRRNLERVLTAFCIHAPDIGYCQGFNFLAGGALLYLDEEDAFWFLVSAVQVLFPPEYFLNDLAGLRADQEVLTSIVREECPLLCDHLNRFLKHFEISVVTTSWFLGLFFDSMDFEVLVRVWDCLLVFGHEALFRISVAIFSIYEGRILEVTEPSQLLHAIKNLPRVIGNADQLIREAFTGLQKFPSWDQLMSDRSEIESKFVEEYNIRQQQCNNYKAKLMKENSKDDDINEKLVFDKSSVGFDNMLLCASCKLSEYSQIYQVNTDNNELYDLSLPINNHVTCMAICGEDEVIVGLVTGQLQAYSISKCFVRWSMWLPNVVLSVEVTTNNLYVGTANSMLHVLKRTEGNGKPILVDTVELSNPPCCMCLVSNNHLWVGCDAGVYVIDIVTSETEGFFLVSLQKDHISSMHYWQDAKMNEDDMQLVWISLENSPIVQLFDSYKFKAGPIMVFDINTDESLSLRQPMMKNTGKTTNNSFFITKISSIINDQVWLSTSNGNVLKYKVVEIDNVSENQEKEQKEEKEDQPGEFPVVIPDDNPKYTMSLISKVQVSMEKNKISCILPEPKKNVIVSVSGYMGEENSVVKIEEDKLVSIIVATKSQETSSVASHDEQIDPDEPSKNEDLSRDSDEGIFSTLGNQSALSTSMPQIAPPNASHAVVMRQKSSAPVPQAHRASTTEVDGLLHKHPTLSVSKSYGKLNGRGEPPNPQQSWVSLGSAAKNAVTSYKEKGAGKFGKMFKGMWKS